MTRPAVARGLEPIVAGYARSLRFFVNGQRVEIENPDPTLHLIDYLRSPEIGLTGTKQSCGQGGCGACTVTLSWFDPETEKPVHRAVNSCFRPLASMDGMAVTTVEGLGSVAGELSPVQYQIAKDNATQCGYCTPGFVMMLHSLLVGDPGRWTKLEIERALEGNICRCTGYRPILHASKRFASDWSRADERGTMVCDVNPGDQIRHQHEIRQPFPDELRQPLRSVYYSCGRYRWCRPLQLAELYRILESCGDAETLKLVVGNSGVGIYDKYGFQGQRGEDPQILVDISHIPDLQGGQLTETSLIVGAATTYTELLSILDHAIDGLPADRRSGLEALHYLAGRTAGSQVRNVASLAGNTMLVARHVESGEPFPSDLYTGLLAMEARVEIGSGQWDSPRLFALSDFVAQYQSDPILRDRSLILAYHVPVPEEREYARSFKLSIRHQNSHSLVNATFRIRVGDGDRIDWAVAVFGGIGPVAFRATNLEDLLRGSEIDGATLSSGLSILRQEIRQIQDASRARMSSLPDMGLTEDYQACLAESFFYKFWIGLAQEIDLDRVSAAVASAAEEFERPESRGTQHYTHDRHEAPARLPYVKLGAFAQASGEASYVKDLPLPGGRGFHAAMVYSIRALASFSYQLPTPEGPRQVELEELVASLHEQFPGVHDLVTARDVPAGAGKAIDDVTYDPVFADGLVTCFGQCVALVLATSKTVAVDAARFVTFHCIAYQPVEDADGSTRQPVLSIDEARSTDGGIMPDSPPYPIHIHHLTRQGSQMDWPAVDGTTEIDGTECQVVTGMMATGGQAHFYMETQACLVEFIEGQSLLVHASTQSPMETSQGIAQTLGIDAGRVTLRVKRLGGGYGGKTTRSAYAANVTAVAAWKSKSPVRLAMTRTDDTAWIGKRHPFLSEHRVAIATGAAGNASRGALIGLENRYWSDGGCSWDCSFDVMNCGLLQSDSAYFVPNSRVTADICRTNTASNTAMRAFGAIQSVILQEEAIEAAAHALGLVPEEVRSLNLYTEGQTTPTGQKLDYCYLREVWERMEERSEFAARRDAVLQFNRANRWRKRGISMMPIKYGMGFSASSLEQGGALIDVLSLDGSVLVRHGGVEMGQGVATKVAQVAATTLDLPLAVVRIGETDTNVVADPVSTGASTGTQLNGTAVQAACLELRRRLEGFAQGLREQHMGTDWCERRGIDYWHHPDGWRAKTEVDGTRASIWSRLVAMAYQQRINLSAQSRIAYPGSDTPITGALEFKPGVEGTFDQFSGYVYGAGCSEVEIDVLTGETTVLRTDIVYDMGKSLNPALDVGQIEGGFMQGLGMVLTEELVVQSAGPLKGALNTLNTWSYKPPSAGTIPIELNIDLFPRESVPRIEENPNLLLSSKEVGEPPLILASTVYFAIKHAVLAARGDRRHDEWFRMDTPATPQRVRQACLVEIDDLLL